MNGNELRNRFNIQYNNNFNNFAPGLNDFEISHYLTKAHKEIIINYYNGTLKGDSFDSNEKTRFVLGTYISTKVITSFDIIDDEFGLKSTVVTLPDKTMYILRESVKSGEIRLTVKPITYDNLNTSIKNPFKKPSLRKAWRLEYNSNSNQRQVKILSLEPISEYSVSVLKTPEPIVIGDLSEVGDDLSIDGVTTSNVENIKTISNILWDIIINRAVELATRDYKENSLSSQIQTNIRTE